VVTPFGNQSFYCLTVMDLFPASGFAAYVDNCDDVQGFVATVTDCTVVTKELYAGGTDLCQWDNTVNPAQVSKTSS
jgi:hypothetical protein